MSLDDDREINDVLYVAVVFLRVAAQA